MLAVIGLPSGTVTFLFADLEGSTQLVQDLGDAYGRVLGDARRILRRSVSEAGGHEIDCRADEYFAAFAEALTNVARYAEATRARVEVRREDDELVVLVADDGVGGVDPSAGGGLRGLEDRVATVGGTLDIDSPIGGGTRLRARIPVPS